ncbi:hypothetical protein ACFXCZ_32325 [Streptomyces sp. NPDC059396]|uniref:hypothetical protein n=1 Tax=Streptomyces sp. NPDC059396 TaxID=3346819 RepID=UPI0036B3B4C6
MKPGDGEMDGGFSTVGGGARRTVRRARRGARTVRPAWRAGRTVVGTVRQVPRCGAARSASCRSRLASGGRLRRGVRAVRRGGRAAFPGVRSAFCRS